MFAGSFERRLALARSAEKPDWLFHYTRGRNALAILRDQEIKRAIAYLAPREKPVVWLSMHSLYEPMALPLTKNSFRVKCVEELAAVDAPFRFEVAPEKFPLGWLAFSNLSRCPARTSRSLKKSAEDAGASVAQWRLSFEPIPAAEWLRVECWHQGRWRDMQTLRADYAKELVVPPGGNSAADGMVTPLRASL